MTQTPSSGKRWKAAVIGGSGYGGAELIRRLLLHPEVQLVRVASVDLVGEPLSAAHPNLEGLSELRFEGITPEQAAEGMDVVLLGLPHKVSAQKVPSLLASGARIVDLSGDFRLRDPAVYRRYYGAEHPSQELLGTFVYGLPELNRARLREARYVASPGCFATTFELALLPLARAGWLSGTVEAVGITGSSGAGVVPVVTTHHPTRAVNLRTYKPLEHQHIPEITETLIAAGAGPDLSLRFVPVSAPLARGIFATAFAHIDAAIDSRQVAEAFADTVRGEPFVRVPARRLPEVAAVSGSNYAEIGFAIADQADAGGRRVVTCFGVTDNLIKGGAGQAIQSMNLMLGLDERLSLEDPGRLAVMGAAGTVVVKLGGEVVGDPRMNAIAADLAALVEGGARLVVVHGGGPQVSALSRRLGLESRIVGGRRVTDDGTLQAVKMAIAGEVNVDLCAVLRAAGLRPVGLGGVIAAVKRPPRVISGGGAEPIDLGHVGDVTGFDLPLIELLLGAGYLPVVACLGAGAGGEVFNINADIVGNKLAMALSADPLVLVTSAPGVLRDLQDPGSRIPALTALEGKAAIAGGAVQGGMIPKLEESFAALAGGVQRIVICDGQVARAVREPGTVGTTLRP